MKHDIHENENEICTLLHYQVKVITLSSKSCLLHYQLKVIALSDKNSLLPYQVKQYYITSQGQFITLSRKIVTLSGSKFMTLSCECITLSNSYYITMRFYYIICYINRRFLHNQL